MGRPPVKPPEEKLRVVMAVLRGEVSVAEAARRAGVSETSVASWRDRFLEGGRRSLVEPARPGADPHALMLEHQLEELKAALGEAHAELRVMKRGALGPSPSRSSR